MHPVPRSQLLLLIFLLLSSLLLSSCQSTQVPASCASCSTASPHAVCTSWQIVPSLNPGNVADQLADVFAAGNDNVWAVGSVSDTSTSRDSRTLVEHWNGSSWTVVPSPNPSPDPSGYPDSLDRIIGSSANDLWAVGEGLGGFLEHWDGHAWSAEATPVVPPGVYAYWYASVSSLSPTDVWVVGRAMSGAPVVGNGDLALTAHWNGREWRVVPSPELHADLNGTVLNDVVALAPNNVWAVGSTSSLEQGQLSLIEHWDGSSWQVIVNPQPQGTAYTNMAAFTSVSALSPTNLWAAGLYESAGVYHYLIEHWDGHAWTVIPTPMPSKPLAGLRQIAAISDHNLWALDSNDVLLHWNGSSWSSASFPNADQNGYSIRRLAAQPDGQLWLVGTVRSPTGPGPRTLIARSC